MIRVFRRIFQRGRAVFHATAALVLCLGMPWGCRRLRPVSPALPVSAPPEFSSSGGRTPPPAEWWKAFGCPGLDAVEAKALAGNLNLHAFEKRVLQAQAALRQARSGLFPAVEANAGLERSRGRSRVQGFGGTSTTVHVRSSQAQAGLAATWEIDLWNRVRATVAAARCSLRAVHEDRIAAAVSVTGQVAETWFRWAGARAQLAVLERQSATDARYLATLETRYDQAQARWVDVLQQRQHIEALRNARIALERQADLLRHALALLLGRPPESPGIPAPSRIPDLPPLPATGVPADLIRRRPDVRAAYWRAAAADRRIAAAAADRFPRLSLSATDRSAAEAIQDLFGPWLASLAANIAAPVFDAGRRRAAVAGARAQAAEMLEHYGQTVLAALREVEDALVAEKRDRAALDSVRRQLELARQALQRIRDMYDNGQADYLRVLEAVRAVDSLERTLIQARVDLLLNRVRLYRALAGAVPPPAADSATPRQRR